MDWKSSLNTVLMGIIAIALTVIAYMTFVQKTTLVPSDVILTQTAPMAKTPEVKTPITQDETADWRTYTSPGFGYSFNYPSTYTLQEIGTDVRVYETSDTSSGQYIVSFHGQKSHTTLDSIIKEETASSTLTEAMPTMINDLSAYEGVIQGMVSWYGVFVQNESDVIRIGFGSTDKGSLQKDRASLTSIQKSILSTFKFTNGSSVSLVGDWKTYTNNSLGFSIKYPSNWKIDSARSDRTMSGSDVVFNVGIPESHEGITVNTSNVSSLDEWAEQAKKNLVLDGAYQGTSYLTVDGQPAVRIDTTEFGGKMVAVLFNGKLYRFDTQGQMIENGMLSTFKFIQ